MIMNKHEKYTNENYDDQHIFNKQEYINMVYKFSLVDNYDLIRNYVNWYDNKNLLVAIRAKMGLGKQPRPTHYLQKHAELTNKQTITYFSIYLKQYLKNKNLQNI